jgi:hypothetical protein
MSIRVKSVNRVHNHNFVKAVVELEVGGLRLQGLKLEQAGHHWRLSPPGRKMLGRWQVLYDFVDSQTYQELLRDVLTHESLASSLPLPYSGPPETYAGPSGLDGSEAYDEFE